MKTESTQLHQLRKTIGAHLHEHRLARRLTLQKLSRLVKIKAEKLDQFEMGKNAITIETLERIAQALHVPLEQFFRPRIPF